MRELKFRAWSEEHKLFYYDAAIENGEAVLLDYVFSFNGLYGVKAVIIDDAIIEQYTGLKDKNGKEIYEGDIVRIDSMDELRVGYVELVAEQYCIVCGEEDGHKIVAEFYYYSKPEENCEVIGNIHENPELVKEDK